MHEHILLIIWVKPPYKIIMQVGEVWRLSLDEMLQNLEYIYFK